MTYKSDLNKADSVAWDEFKRQMVVDRKKKIFKESANLGNCLVAISSIDGELYIEIMPNETTNFNGSIAGTIVPIDENNCHLDNVMEMARNAKKVKEAKGNGEPIKLFTQKSFQEIDQ